MENVKKNVLASINARFSAMKSVAPFDISEKAKVLMTTDISAAIELMKSEKLAYEAVNAVSPIEQVSLQAVLGAVVGFDSEDEAFTVLNKAKACWRSAKGLRGLFLSTLNEAILGEFNGDLSRGELVAVCKAWAAKGEQTQSAFLDAHKLQKTAGNVLGLNGALVVKVAALPTEETKEENKPTKAPAKLTAAQITKGKK